jgi:hypothetical protein
MHRIETQNHSLYKLQFLILKTLINLILLAKILSMIGKARTFSRNLNYFPFLYITCNVLIKFTNTSY